MATYKEIKGVTVQALDADPVTNTGSWASGGNTNSPHSGYGGSSGTYTAALVAANEPYGANVELYDGSSWTETGNLNTSRVGAFSAGTQPATWLGGGRTGPAASTNNTETFNGSSWTETNEMNTTRFSSGSTGTYTAGIAVSGNTFTDISREVETWNGTTWSTHPNNYDADVAEIITFGTTTAAIMAGGFDGPAPRGGSNTSVATAYSYDGSTYTSITALPQTLNNATGTGSQTDAIAAGGNRYPAPDTANTVAWNGTSWSQVQDVPTAAYAYGGAKATTNTENQLAFCGLPGAATSTFEWAFPPPTAAILTEGDVFLSGGTTLKGFGRGAGIPAGTWASAANMNTGRSRGANAGTYTAALAIGGTPSPGYTEVWDGSSWSETGDLNTGRTELGGAGTSTAAQAFAGGSPNYDLNETFNGTSWTEGTDLNTGRQGSSGCGSTNTASICVGGSNPSASALTELWDGSSWTETGDLNTAREFLSSLGSSTAAIAVGGLPPPSGAAITEKWNGSSWTEVGDLNTARYYVGGTGSQISALAVGGSTGSDVANVEGWNGTSWTEINDIATAKAAKFAASNTGGAARAIASGGSPATNVTEEFTADNVLSTITVS